MLDFQLLLEHHHAVAHAERRRGEHERTVRLARRAERMERWAKRSERVTKRLAEVAKARRQLASGT